MERFSEEEGYWENEDCKKDYTYEQYSNMNLKERSDNKCWGHIHIGN